METKLNRYREASFEYLMTVWVSIRYWKRVREKTSFPQLTFISQKYAYKRIWLRISCMYAFISLYFCFSQVIENYGNITRLLWHKNIIILD